MTREHLFEQIRAKESFLCIGLDTDFEKLPVHLKRLDQPLYEFNKSIIDHTHDKVVAYKPNLAFYEYHGTEGWHQLELTIQYIRTNYPDIFIIADAKRGDIGNTASKYAGAFYNQLNCDGITLSPYMGSDSLKPYLDCSGKWVILLALTSNRGAEDFQLISNEKHERLFESVLIKSSQWGSKDNMMFVVGATRANMLVKVREIVPDHFLLIPGIGAQGGSLEEVAEYGLNRQCGLIVNSSRSILYADFTSRFAVAARNKSIEIQSVMKKILKQQF